MECTCKLKLKDGAGIIRTSEFVSRPVHLGKISESDYPFYEQFFPDAFELNVKGCELHNSNPKKKIIKRKKKDASSSSK